MATKAKAKVVSKSTTKKVTAKKAAPKAAVKAKTTSKATPASKKQTATTKKVVSKVAMKAASKSAVKPGMKKVEVKKPVMAAQPAVKAAAPVASAAPKAPVAAPVAAAGSKKGFAVNEYVVYPTHGVGKILGMESEKIGDYELKVFVIAFEKDKMILRVPVGRAEAAGLRAISPNDQINRALATLKGRAKIARGMWSRRAQEYEAKINSGNLIQIAEVVRDLHKNVDQSERSYSERMIYETAMHRLCGEVAASERVEIKIAQDKLLKVLRKQAAEAA